MDATFRMRRSYRNQGAWCLPVFLAWAAFGAYLALTDSNIPHRMAALLFFVSVPLFMAMLAFWMLLAYWREALTIRGDRLAFRGVFRRTEFNLRDIAEGRWRTRPVGGSLVLRTEPKLRLNERCLGIGHYLGRGVGRPRESKLTLNFGNYATDESESLVRHFRAVLEPDVQSGWNLFAYKITTGEPEPQPKKPGPDEILLRRDRWDRWLLPTTLVVLLVGVLVWGITREVRFLLPTLGPVALWAYLRLTTPAEGMIVRRLSHSFEPEARHFLAFLILWGIVAVVAVFLIDAWQPKQAAPNVAMIVVAVIWVIVLLVEGGLHDRRQARREREKAELAAKARGEPSSDPWDTV